MKKYAFLFITIGLLVCLCCVLGACGEKPDGSGETYVITVHPNNGGKDVVMDNVSELNKLTYAGHTLAGYYLDAACTQQTSMLEIRNLLKAGNVDVYLAWVESATACQHNLVVMPAVEPTCTKPGLTEGARCSICGEVVVPQEGRAALGHDPVSHAARAATCTEDGWDAYTTCSRCDYTTYQSIPAKGHREGGWVEDTPVSCTTDGVESTMCTTCGVVLRTRTVHALGHDYQRQVISRPTCTEAGITHATCSRCTYATDEVEPALGHYIVHHDGRAATCTEDGYAAYDTCGRCTYTTYTVISAKGHREGSWTQTAAPTCTAEGQEQRRCTVCNVVIDERTVNSLGHNYVAYGAQVSTCVVHGHNAYQVCLRCGDSTYEELPLIDHTAGDWVQTVDPTCTVAGTKEKRCTTCNLLLQQESVSALGHDQIYHAGKEPTCSESGYTEYYTCTRCDLDTRQYIDKLPHTPGDWMVDYAPTCTQPGCDKQICTVCGELLGTRSTDAIGHNPGDWVEDYAPTCTETGRNYVACSVCGEVLEEFIVPALGHTPGNEDSWVVEREPTCEVAGYRYKCCLVCSAVVVEDYPAALGHDKVFHERREPTCSMEGCEEYYTCRREGCTYTTYVAIEKLGHVGGQWEENVAPTCTESGEDVVRCQECGTIINTRGVNPLGHDYVNHDAHAVSCTEDGWEAYRTCTRCDYNEQVIIPATGHDGHWRTVLEPTCTEEGEEVCECRTCGAELERRAIEPLQHDNEWNELTAATCTEPGSGRNICRRCHTQFQIEQTEPLGHDNVSHEGKQPTCTETGWEPYTTCNRCGLSTYATLPANGHTAGDWLIEAYPTCTQGGFQVKKCTVCDAVLDSATLDALGHTESDWMYFVAPTCTEGGQEHKICTVCSVELDLRDVDPLGHDYQSTHHDATCIAYEYTEYTCSRCADYFTETPSEPQYGPHHFVGMFCTACNIDMLSVYNDEFMQGIEVNSSTNYYLIEADDALDVYRKTALFVDWALFYANTLNRVLYFKPDVLINDASELSTVWTACSQFRCYTNAMELSTYSESLIYSIDLTTSHGYNSIYPAEEPDGTSYAIVNGYPKQESVQTGSYVAARGQQRDINFTNFPYTRRTNKVSVRTSDELYFAFANGYCPVPVEASEAERVLNAAFDVLRGYEVAVIREYFYDEKLGEMVPSYDYLTIEGIVDNDMTDVQKLAAIYQWFLDNVTYDYGAIEDYEFDYRSKTAYYADGVFFYHRAVCDGIAKAVCILAGIENIRCVRVTGYKDGTGTGHAWNAVWIDTDDNGVCEWYLMDCTNLHRNVNVTNGDQTDHYVCDTYQWFLFSSTLMANAGYAAQYTNMPEVVAPQSVNPYLFFYRDSSGEDSKDYCFTSTAELNEFVAYYMDNGHFGTCSTDYETMEFFITYKIDIYDARSVVINAFKRVGADVAVTISTRTIAGYKGVGIWMMICDNSSN